MDANFNVGYIAEIVDQCHQRDVPGECHRMLASFLTALPVWFQPTSVEKSGKFLAVAPKVSFVSPNRNEWINIYKLINPHRAVPQTTLEVMDSVHSVSLHLCLLQPEPEADAPAAAQRDRDARG